MYENILVSIIIPVFNVEKYVGKSIESAMVQTHSNVEILIIDGGSTDQSLSICKRFADIDSRIRIILQENKGLGLARDLGIDNAKGEYICFLDGDDYYESQFVEILLKAAIKNRSFIARCHFIKRFNGDTSPIIQEPYNEVVLEYKDYILYNFFDKNGNDPFGCWMNIYHCSLFEEIRFGDYRFAEDSAFTPRITYAAKARPMVVVNQVLYHYVQRPGSLLNEGTTLKLLDRFKAKRAALDFWLEKGEMGIHNLYYHDYLSCLIMDYTNLCRDLPSQKEQYAYLLSEIEKASMEAFKLHIDSIVFPAYAKKVWLQLANNTNKFILYGFGNVGKSLMPWMQYFKVNLLEIWDENADSFSDGIGEISIVRPYTKKTAEITVLIAIDDKCTAKKVELKLRDMGFVHFIDSQTLKSAMKFGIYTTFIPFVIKKYEELL